MVSLWKVINYFQSSEQIGQTNEFLKFFLYISLGNVKIENLLGGLMNGANYSSQKNCVLRALS